MTNNDDDGHLLARIDERVRHIEHMVEDFVTQMEFIPIKLIVFGLVGICLTGILVAIVAQVLR